MTAASATVVATTIGRWKQKIIHELAEYWMNVAYLTLAFAAFTQYRRLILAAHDISYVNYWVAVIQALILAKVIMIGSLFHLGRRFERWPLIYTTIYKTIVFSTFVAAFAIVEHAVRGWWSGEGAMAGVDDYFGKGPEELLAGCLIVFVAFLPFFGFKELGRVLEPGRVTALFFSTRDGQ